MHTVEVQRYFFWKSITTWKIVNNKLQTNSDCCLILSWWCNLAFTIDVPANRNQAPTIHLDMRAKEAWGKVRKRSLTTKARNIELNGLPERATVEKPWAKESYCITGTMARGMHNSLCHPILDQDEVPNPTSAWTWEQNPSSWTTLCKDIYWTRET